MPRFQSRLFNWVDCSLPVQLGRRVRKLYDQLVQPGIERGSTNWQEKLWQEKFWQEVGDNIGKQTAKIFLYPVYALTETAKQTYPQLKSQTTRPPLLLRPVEKLILWVDNTKLFKTKHDRAQNGMSLSDKVFLASWQEQFQISVESEPKRDRIRELIKAAIAYFFGKKAPVEQLDSTPADKHKSDLKISSQTDGEPWLTMSDVFGDDNGPWPYPARSRSEQLSTNSIWHDSDLELAKNPVTGGLARKSHETSTSDLTHAGIEGGILAEAEDQSKRSRPMQAWIETQATFLGYVYSPVMNFIHWLDRLFARLEQWLVKQWHKLLRALRIGV